MCGFAGALQIGCRNDEWQHTLLQMAASIAHRGPDAEGAWFDAEAGIGLAVRRLSILDLSPHGHQPMISAGGRYVIAYNGEVYNFETLRRELEKSSVTWRGHSDTEVILAAIEAWGLEAAIQKFIGMFAFALWDRTDRTLSLVRDRLGIKPLYYGWGKNALVFGSELKALRAHPSFEPRLNHDAVVLVLRHKYIPAPHSIYEGVYKLEPGRILQVSTAAIAQAAKASSACYWSAKRVAQLGQETLFGGSEREAVDHLETLLRDAVKQCMVSDVPLGAFLSGGIDSSTVVALMQTQSDHPVKTFTIGFNESSYDEAKYAKEVARHLGTEHTELYVTPEEALNVIPKLPTLFDEPFSDSSQIPTFLVSAMARQHVTVCLSGDGGDELFAGYRRYAVCREIWNKLGWIPSQLRRMVANTLIAAPDVLLNAGFFWLTPFFKKYGRPGVVADKLKTVAEVLTCPTPEGLYHERLSDWKDPSTVVILGKDQRTLFTDPSCMPDLRDFTHRMMFLDTVTYLPDDILTKVDRASMGVSLETRVPLLDHRVVEFAWRLPLAHKVAAGLEKRVLRQVLYRYVPPEIVDRPKKGFGVPMDVWLRGPLRDWAEDLLDERRLKVEEIFDPQPVRQKWQEHLSGKRNWHYCLWNVLMFQAWKEENKI